MIARHEGAIVFVSGSIPGETVDAVVEKVQRGTIWASTKAIAEASADRLADVPDGACGGCVFNHIRYERQLELKRAIIEDTFRRIGHITLEQPIDVTPSPIDGYRMRARLHARGGHIGFFREGSHALCDAASTRQLRPDTIEALRAIAAGLVGLSADTQAEIELSENIDASQRAFYAEPSIPVASDAAVSDTIRGVTLTRGARSFFQANRFLILPLVDHVIAACLEGPLVDLYAGVGLFSLTAAPTVKGAVIAVEGDPQSSSDLKKNIDRAGGGVEAVSTPVEEYLRRTTARPSTLIVDPPRTGLSRGALDGALALGAPRLVYVSCDIATLARDARLILEAGYAIDTVRAFDMFPNTAHIETVLSFSRR
jgi:23S rRNA (uracil1939-C5)-methyltransferase